MASEESKVVKEQMQVVVFKIAGEEYAAPILDIKEIIKMAEITEVPNTPNYIEGIINLRGKVIVVLDLVKKFHMRETAQPTHIVIAQVEENLFGIVVDEVVEVLRTDKETIKPTPKLMQAKIHTEYINNVVVLGQRIVILLDIPALLTHDDFAEVHAIANHAEWPPKSEAEQEEYEEEGEHYLEEHPSSTPIKKAPSKVKKRVVKKKNPVKKVKKMVKKAAKKKTSKK